MIISANSIPNLDEYNELLISVTAELNGRASKSYKEVVQLSGNKLEPYVKDVLSHLAIGTSFEGSIELVSGQKFPDIIAKKYFGVEVKSTTQNHWKTTGNSVLESTRVDGIERIFMLFGKLGNPIEFRHRPYEECLSEVVVTHSPRYLIDMNLAKGATIFDKMEIPYDELRRKQNPIHSIVSYYKNKLKPGEDVWWIEQGDFRPASSIVVRVWNILSKQEKQRIKIKALSFFPELFSNSPTKFYRIAVWLATREAIVCHNIRDLFTAGGKINLTIKDKQYLRLPMIIKTLFDNIHLVYEQISNTPKEELSNYWQCDIDSNGKLNTWISLLEQEMAKALYLQKLPIREMIYAVLEAK